jgi:hypothetical protein
MIPAGCFLAVNRQDRCLALAPAQQENNQHDYDDDDYGTDTDIHRLFLSWQRPVSIDDEVPGAIFGIGLGSATRTWNLKPPRLLVVSR